MVLTVRAILYMFLEKEAVLHLYSCTLYIKNMLWQSALAQDMNCSKASSSSVIPRGPASLTHFTFHRTAAKMSLTIADQTCNRTTRGETDLSRERMRNNAELYFQWIHTSSHSILNCLCRNTLKNHLLNTFKQTETDQQT